jgi:hypothetical protein
MAISELFKLLNLNQKKLCTDEIRRAKMKKNEKNHILQLKKCIFFTALFWLLLWLCKA